MYLQNLEMGKWAITEKPQGKISKSKKVPCRKVTLFKKIIWVSGDTFLLLSFENKAQNPKLFWLSVITYRDKPSWRCVLFEICEGGICEGGICKSQKNLCKYR